MELCSIASGSSGNCVFVGSDHVSLLVDAGISGKRVREGLGCLDRCLEDIDGILVTHEHSDHIQGLGVLARRCRVPIYATAGTIRAIRRTSSLGKFPEGIFHEIRRDEPFCVGEMEVKPFAISHDAAEPVGYRLECGGRAVAVATDMGIYDDYTVEHLQKLDALLLEANHDVHMLQVGGYPYYLKQRILGDRGHLSNENAGKLLCRLLHEGLQTVLLGHLSKENNYEKLAYETVRSEITLGENPYTSGDFDIRVASRDVVSEPVTV